MKQIIFLSIIISLLPCFVKNKEILVTAGSSNASITPRILGGEDALDITVFPYQMALRLHGVYVCSAASISQIDVLTAAHCITHTEGLMWPYAGVTLHGGTAASFQLGNVHLIMKITVHPGWTGTYESAHNHDLAHLKLSSAMILTVSQDVADLPGENVVSNVWGYVTGWGVTDLNNPSIAPILQFLQMWSLRYDHCQPFMNPDTTLHPTQMCAYQENGHGCCQGDSGAPFVMNNVLVGIHSWIRAGYDGGGEPEIFTNIYKEMDFIDLARQLE